MQVSLNINTTDWLITELPIALREDTAIIAQDAERTEPLETLTIMAKQAATRKWVPLTKVSPDPDTDVTIPVGVYVGEPINATDLVAGDVTDCQILIANAIIVEDMVKLENELTMDDIVTEKFKTIRDVLAEKNIHFRMQSPVSAPQR